MLTLKLTMLAALASASRCSEIRHLNVSLAQDLEENFVLTWLSQPKREQFDKNKCLPVLEFELFQDDNNICVSRH